MPEIEEELEALLKTKKPWMPKGKDVSPHHIGTVAPQEPIQQLLDRVNAQDIREDVFLQAVALELQTYRERLRHRADMMRRRAQEFDEYADDLGHREEAIKEYVFMLLNHMKEVNEVLDAHAHVEPTKVTNGTG